MLSASSEKALQGLLTKFDGENFDHWAKDLRGFFRVQRIYRWITPTWVIDVLAAKETGGINSATTEEKAKHLLTPLEADKLENIISQNDDLETERQTVLMWMRGTVNRDYKHYINSEFPYVAWQNIERSFKTSGATGEFRILKKMENLRFPDTSGIQAVIDFLAARSQIKAEASSIGVNFIDLDREQLLRFEILRFLSKLPEEFSPLVDQVVNGLDNYPTVESVELKLRTYAEMKYEVREESSTALLARRQDNRKPQNKNNKHCTYCGKDYHDESECFKKPENADKRPAWWRDNKTATDDNVTKTRTLVTYTPTDRNVALLASSDVFILDSGATIHLTSRRDALWSYQAKTEKVYMADDSFRYTEGAGTLVFLLKDPDSSNPNDLTEIKVTNVHYAPWCQNLISTGSIANLNNNIEVVSNSVQLKINLGAETLMVGKAVGKLYLLDFHKLQMPTQTPLDESAFKAIQSNTPSTDALNKLVMGWHVKLQHAGYTTMKRMIDELDLGAKIDLGDALEACKEKIQNCTICVRGKATRSPFTAAKKRDNAFDLVHADLVGPLSGQLKYLLAITDDATGYVWGWAMKSKDETGTLISAWLTLLKNQYGMTPKVFRSDGGGEFNNRFTKPAFAQHGVRFEITVPYTPEQNGVAERFNRSILDKTRCAIIQAKVSEEMWPHAAAVAIECINQTRNYRNIRPSTALFKTKPVELDANNFHAFGCLVLARPPKKTKTKFEPRAIPCLYMGNAYEGLGGPTPRQKGFKLWNPSTGKIMISRDVRFYENVFPGSKFTLSDIQKQIDGDPSPESTHASVPPEVVELEETEKTTDDDNDVEIYVEIGKDRGPTPPDSPVMSRTEQNIIPLASDSTTPGTPQPLDLSSASTTSENSDAVSGSVQPIVTTTPLQPAARRVPTTETRSGRTASGQPSVSERPATRSRQVASHSEISANGRQVITKRWGAYVNNSIIGLHEPFMPERVHLARDNVQDWPDTLGDDDVPKTLEEAKRSPWWHLFSQAMDEQYRSLIAYGVFEICMPPPEAQVLGGRWVFQVKKNAVDSVVHTIKARWVVKGFQQHDIDYQATFSPVAKITTIRILLAWASKHNLSVLQADAKDAFLHADLAGATSKEVYMCHPDNFESGEAGSACRLVKAMWGLKESPLAFFAHFDKVLRQLGLTQAEPDECLYLGNNVTVVVYVDDFLIVGNHSDAESLMSLICSRMKVDRRGGLVKAGDKITMLGINIVHTGTGFILSQKAKTQEFVDAFTNDRSASSSTPMDDWRLKEWFAAHEQGGEKAVDRTKYLQAIGKLLYLATATRPDLAFVTGTLARYSADPKEPHWLAIHRVARYLKATTHRALDYTASTEKVLQQWSDADFAGDEDTRRSTSGALVQLYGMPVTWWSTRQRAVSTSTLQAEYISFAKAARTTAWIINILGYFGAPQVTPVTAHIDNLAALHSLTDPIARSEKLRHLDVAYKYVRELIAGKIIEARHCTTNNMAADGLTKALRKQLHDKSVKMLGLIDID